MEDLQKARPGVEERRAVPCVAEGVDGGEKEVECETPISKVGEVGEGLAGDGGAAVGGLDGAPDYVKEEDGEGVKGLELESC